LRASVALVTEKNNLHSSQDSKTSDGLAEQIGLNRFSKPGLRAFYLSIIWLLIGFVQPLTMFVLGVILCWHLVGLAVWQLVCRVCGQPTNWPRWRQLARIVIVAGILPGIFILYNAWISYSDPYVRAWADQNLIRSPHPAHYLLAYGLLLPYAVWGGRRLLRDHPWTGWLPVGWILLFPLLAYAPIDLQRRLTEGVWAAWVTIAMVALDRLTLTSPSSRRSWMALPMWLLFPSTALLLVGGVLAVRSPNAPLFRPQDEVRVFEYLQSQEEVNKVVLTAYETGNALPAWAPVRVVIGHGPESVNLAELEPHVTAFYTADTLDIQRLDLIHQFDVRYVLWGPAERALGSWSPYQADYLHPVYQSGTYQLFQVVETP
jgi:hypothetical protein